MTQEINNIESSLTEAFVVIQCGYEGIEGLIFASSSGDEAAEKVKALRDKILKAQERMNQIIAEHGSEEDEEYRTHYDRMFDREEIDWEEYNDAKYREPDAYCVQKWDGKKFSCVCEELGCKPEKTWLM